jgi:succinate dehydrogenase / fumarate reductase, membrane anchor subunit
MGNGTSIGRVRGLGSAHAGNHDWLVQRYTAVASLLLGVWFVASLVMLPNLDYGNVAEWLTRPFPALAVALFLVSSIWHAKIGLQVVIEDYVHEPANKFGLLMALNLVAFAAAAAGLFFLLRLIMVAAGSAAVQAAVAAAGGQ